MTAFTERQAVIVAGAITNLPAEKRRAFVQRLDAMLRQRTGRRLHSDYEVETAVQLVLAGLVQTPGAA
jgi:hypothetical protein